MPGSDGALPDNDKAVLKIAGKIGYPGLDYGLAGVFGANFGFYNAARSNNIHYVIVIPTSTTAPTRRPGRGTAYPPTSYFRTNKQFIRSSIVLCLVSRGI